MVDRGANGGLAGSDVRILSRSSSKCTVTGIDSHELQGLDVVQFAALVETNHGIVNLIMNEYACYGKGHTIHSSGQIEWFKNSLDDRSVQVGGKQRICTIDGYAMPLTCRGGLMYLSILGKPTDKDLERGTQLSTLQSPINGILQSCTILTPLVMGSLLGPMTLLRDLPLILTLMSLGIIPKGCTQWGVSLPNTFPMKKHIKSRNPALNIPRRHEAVATDTVFSDTPAVDSGVKQAQVLVGRDTLVAGAYPMKSGKQFVNTIEDNIRRRGAMDKLLSDSAKT